MKKIIMTSAMSITAIFLAGCNSTTTSNYEMIETSGADEAFEVEIAQEVAVEHDEESVYHYEHVIQYPNFFDGLSDMMVEAVEEEFSEIENVEDYITVDTESADDEDISYLSINVDVDSLSATESEDIDTSIFGSFETLNQDLLNQGFDKVN